MRQLLLALSMLVAVAAAPAHAQFGCPGGGLEKKLEITANWTASVWDLTSTIRSGFYYDVHQDGGGLGQVVFRAISRFPITTSTLRGRRVMYADLEFRSARARDVIGSAWVGPSLYNGTGLGLDDVRGISAAQLNQGVILGLGRGLWNYEQTDGFVGPYYAPFENEGIAALNAALSIRASSFSIAVEPLYRGIAPRDVPPHAALMKAPVLTVWHCAAF